INLAEELCKPSLVIERDPDETYFPFTFFISAGVNQDMSPSFQYSLTLVLGVPPPITSPNSETLNHFQLGGISNGVSSSAISIAFFFLICPSSINRFLSSWICAYNSSALPSSSSFCSTNFPCIAN